MTDTRRQAAEEWADQRYGMVNFTDRAHRNGKKCMECGWRTADVEDAHLAGQECGEQRMMNQPGTVKFTDEEFTAQIKYAEDKGEQRAVEGICKRLRYWQKELNVAFDYAADIENGGWKEKVSK